MKLGALFFVLLFQTSYAIQLQLLGGIWICQTLPAVLIALYTRFFNPWALLAGWVAGIGAGSMMVLELGLKSSIYPLHIFGLTIPCYAALLALVLNIAVGFVLSVILNATSKAPRHDETVPSDYLG